MVEDLRVPDRLSGQYYTSITDAIKETVASQRRMHSFQKTFPFLFALLFMGSPWLFGFLAGKLALLFGYSTPAKWVYVGGALVGLSAGLGLIMFLTESLPRNVSRKWLRPSQLRFAFCYTVSEQLGKYELNRRPEHLRLAQSHWISLLRSLQDLGGDEPLPSSAWKQLSPPKMSPLPQPLGLFAGIQRHQQMFPWFVLDPSTDQVIQALRDLPMKAHDRLRDGKDIGTLKSSFFALADYFYTSIPELAPSHEAERNALVQWGLQRLDEFTRQIRGLPDYASERTETREYSLLKVLAAMGRKGSAALAHPNLLINFLSWWVVMEALIAVCAIVAVRWIGGIRVDSSILSLIVGVPPVCAATIALIARRQLPPS